jgi:hypothetical protein
MDAQPENITTTDFRDASNQRKISSPLNIRSENRCCAYVHTHTGGQEGTS